MLDRRFLIWSAVIGVFLPLGLIGFYAFSADLGDGLEVTMEKGNVEEGEPVISSPLDYGENYLGTLLMGAIGTLVTLAAVLIVLFLLSKRVNKEEGSSR